MELFKLFGTIAMRNSEANKGIDDTTDKAKRAKDDIEELGDEGTRTEGKLGSAFSKIGSAAVKVGQTIGVGMLAASAAVIKIGKDAIDAYSDYEQLVGGVETLFGAGGKSLEEYADSVGKSVEEVEEKYNELIGAQEIVLENSANAYKTAGLSANDYMETVTSISASLIQSLNGDTTKAAEVADMAITDMSDNANKMGTSIDSIQNAYQGFAKQNYTMLDNLKLGYGGTKEEMQRLLDDANTLNEQQGKHTEYQLSNYADIVAAIHDVQTNMGITGTTAQEASTTIQGSLASAKAAWENLLTGMTDDTQNFDQLIDNFFDSIATVGENLIPRISTVLDGVANLIERLAPRIIEKIPDIVDTLLPPLINGAVALLRAVVDVIPQIVEMLVDVLPDIIDGVEQIFKGIVDALPELMKTICDALPTLIPQVNQLLNDNTRHVLHDNSTESCVIIDPHVHLEDNEVGSFSFRIASTHPYYSIISKLKSIITVESNGEEIFRGRPTEQRGDFNNTKEFYCEDELSYLTHSVQRQAEYHDISPRGFLETLIEVHNAQVEEDKHFVVGAVTVVDSNDSLYRYTNYEDTLTCIKTKLVKKLGGHLRIRIVNGVRYLDYLADYPRINTQEIEFGKNLLDFSQTVDVSDLATAVIPLGAYLETATIEALDERLSIRSVNNDVDFIYSASAVQNYGWKFKVVTFDDVHVPANLLRKGREYLTDAQFENLVLECSALDLSHLNVNIEQIMLLDQVRVHSEPHELNKLFPVSVLDIYLNNPEDNSIVLGNAERIASYTSSSISNDQKIMERINGIPSERVVLNEAIANATALINAATHGYVVLTPEELLIMNTDNTATAKKVWRWNLGGLGYSSSGYNGPYATAITMDGQIVGERIAAHSVSADKLSIEYVSEVERKISAAEANAKSDTDQKLTDYWTSAEVRTQIANTADSVLLSATEEAKSYTDSALSDYCTKAALRVEVSNITAEVSKKINASEWSTRIQQSATDIQIAWNNISRYIQFADAKLQIKDESNNPLIELSHTGMDFSYKNKAIGRIGCFSTLGTNHTGLEFELNNSAEYMAWVVRASGQISSSPKLVYANENITNGYKAGLHFACETYSDGNLYLDDNNNIKLLESGVGYEGVFSFGDYNSSSNVFDRRITLSKNYFNIWNNVGINFYSALNMHNYVIYNTNLVNSSDSRLKTNIQPTKINALDFINALELKQFEWIESGEFEPVGVIAQQLQEIAPELVEEVDGKLSIKTTKFIFYLLKAVQELSDKSGKSTKSKWQDPYSDEEKRDFCKGYNDELDGLSKISARTKAIPSTEHKSPKNKKGDSNGRK